jgi:hypothetical protein
VSTPYAILVTTIPNDCIDLIPQLCSKVSISRRTYRAIFQVPSIIHHMERQLLAAEVNASIFDHSIHDGLLQCSLTSRAALMDVDYERLEFLGAYVDMVPGHTAHL